MQHKKILILATYPIVEPRDGGQKRVTAIVKEYTKAFGQVKFVGIFKGRYPAYRASDIYVKSDGGIDPSLVPFVGDVIAGQAVYQDQQVRRKLTALLRSFQPDVIELEQIYLYIGLKPLLAELNLHPKLILNSQNIEYPMKQNILDSIGVAKAISKPIVELIKNTETDLSREADLVVAVSEADGEAHKKMGAKSYVVAANGIEPVVPSDRALAYWQHWLQSHAVGQAVTFIGSAHPPNWVGFLKMVGEGMGFMPPNARLFLGGSIADYFQQNITGESPTQLTFWQRVVPAGRMTDDRLAGLIAISDILLLPIVEGGGSNLKTAEAILSGKKIVATSYAFRSFETYLKLPNIFIADTPEDFRQAIVRALQTPAIAWTAEQTKIVEHVQWRYTLKQAIEAVSKL